MKNPLGIILLVGGAILLLFGLFASESLGSDFSRFFTGTPTDKSIWMIIGGAIALAVGLIFTVRTRNV